MPRKPSPKPDNPEQFKRFMEMAREVGANTDPKTLDRVLEKVAHSPKKLRPPKRSIKTAPMKAP